MLPRPSRIIVPQYTRPKDLSLVASAELLGDGKRAIAAQVIDFAVRKVVTISREKGKGRKTGFTLTLADAAAENPDEKAVLATLFDEKLLPGATLTIAPGRNRQLGVALKNPHRWIVARLISNGLAAERGFWSRLVTPWRSEPVLPTAKAEPLVDHLWGIRDYIALAEKERFAFLQGPTTAQRREPVGQLEALVLNEKLLPFAVLFGLEKEWARELDLQYRDLPPELLDDLDGALMALELLAHSGEIISGVADLVELVDAADALEGVGAFFGGLGDVLGNFDFPDIG
ncbi:hypothetical protein BH10ACT7_BH10ACT7_11640 [soil metagenome]